MENQDPADLCVSARTCHQQRVNGHRALVRLSQDFTQEEEACTFVDEIRGWTEAATSHGWQQNTQCGLHSGCEAGSYQGSRHNTHKAIGGQGLGSKERIAHPNWMPKQSETCVFAVWGHCLRYIKSLIIFWLRKNCLINVRSLLLYQYSRTIKLTVVIVILFFSFKILLSRLRPHVD